MSEMNGQGNKAKKGISFAVILLLTVIGAAIIGAGIWAVNFIAEARNVAWNASTPTPGASNTQTDAPSDPTTPTPGGEEPTPTPGDTEPSFTWGKDVLNILVIGYDKADVRDQNDTFRTDTLILVTIFFNENRVVMTSVPRDSYVLIGSDFTHKDKINSVPFWSLISGEEKYSAICSTVSRLFGNIPVDYYFAIDMDVFVEVIDELGGIEYDVDVDVAYNGNILIHKGLQVLNGEQALQYVQYRRTPNGDIDRVSRQRKFLMAAFAQLKSLNKIMKLPSIYNIVMDKINTNLTYQELTNLALFAAEDLDTNNISGNTFPGNFSKAETYKVSYWIIDQDRRVYYIYELFGITVPREEQDPR